MSDDKIENKNKRNPSSHVRFTDSELKKIQRAQQETGLSIPDLLKKAFFQNEKLMQPLFSKDDTSKFMTELVRQGNNINQIAKAINSGFATGWNQSLNNLQKAYWDLRHLLSVNHGIR